MNSFTDFLSKTNQSQNDWLASFSVSNPNPSAIKEANNKLFSNHKEFFSTYVNTHIDKPAIGQTFRNEMLSKYDYKPSSDWLGTMEKVAGGLGAIGSIASGVGSILQARAVNKYNKEVLAMQKQQAARNMAREDANNKSLNDGINNFFEKKKQNL